MPTAAELARLKLAVIQKAMRLLLLPESPLGNFGEQLAGVSVPVPKDYAIKELLYGFRGKEWGDFDLYDDLEVTTEDVIRVGFNNPEQFPEFREDDVEDAVAAAKSWVADYLRGFPFA